MRKFLFLIAALATLPLGAQNVDIEALSGLQFNFGNPGARSLGMGGAFLGLADDASAAEANPAGLTVLQKPEFAVELRQAMELKSIPVRGVFPNIELGSSSTKSRLSEVAFASVVLPVRGMSVAAYYHRVVG